MPASPKPALHGGGGALIFDAVILGAAGGVGYSICHCHKSDPLSSAISAKTCSKTSRYVARLFRLFRSTELHFDTMRCSVRFCSLARIDS